MIQCRARILRASRIRDPLAILVAINAIYFKDLREKQFEPSLTREELFHTSDRRRVKTPLMSQYGSYPYIASLLFLYPRRTAWNPYYDESAYPTRLNPRFRWNC